MRSFAGILSPEPARPQDNLLEAAPRLSFAIRHRGPYDACASVDASACFALSHAILATVYRSVDGHQPMVGVSGRYVIGPNAESYNHLEQRAELERTEFTTSWHRGAEEGGARCGPVTQDALAADARPVWLGRSAIETLLAVFEQWGLGLTLQECVGSRASALESRPASPCAHP
jgi:asparagine synthase (glutamine-hydrolysing)